MFFEDDEQDGARYAMPDGAFDPGQVLADLLGSTWSPWHAAACALVEEEVADVDVLDYADLVDEVALFLADLDSL